MTIPVKKLIIMNILDILRRYSDEDHRLSQKDIVEILKTEYNMTVERRTIRRNILNLMDCGYEIEYSESVRMVPNRKTGELEESYIWSDFYLVRDFTDSELRLLIDSLLFSKHIPYSQCKELVEKLEGLSNTYFRSRVKHIRMMPETAPENRQVFYTIEVLDEAISQGKKVSFHYNSFGLDKTLHPREGREGGVKEYIVSPYQIAATNGRYYLICNTDPHDNVSHYRLDRITEIQVLDDVARPANSVQGLEHGINLPQHMAEHIYMFSGESVPVVFRMKTYILNDVIDWFGTGVEFSDADGNEVTAHVKVNLQAMRLWAVQYGPHIRILSPESLVRDVIADLQRAINNHDNSRVVADTSNTFNSEEGMNGTKWTPDQISELKRLFSRYDYTEYTSAFANLTNGKCEGHIRISDYHADVYPVIAPEWSGATVNITYGFRIQLDSAASLLVEIDTSGLVPYWCFYSFHDGKNPDVSDYLDDYESTIQVLSEYLQRYEET